MTSEHETFAKLHASLNEAASALNQIGAFRPDQRKEWELMANLLHQVQEQIYAIAMKKVN